MGAHPGLGDFADRGHPRPCLLLGKQPIERPMDRVGVAGPFRQSLFRCLVYGENRALPRYEKNFVLARIEQRASRRKASARTRRATKKKASKKKGKKSTKKPARAGK